MSGVAPIEEVLVLCCAECEHPLATIQGRGQFCLHCAYEPSMQDTFFRKVKVPIRSNAPPPGRE